MCPNNSLPFRGRIGERGSKMYAGHVTRVPFDNPYPACSWWLSGQP